MSSKTRSLTADAQPTYQGTPDEFHNHIENGEYNGELPIEHFTITHNTVVMDADLASQLEWIIFETHDGTANAFLTTQQLDVNGETLTINPGTFPVFIDKTDLQSPQL